MAGRPVGYRVMVARVMTVMHVTYTQAHVVHTLGLTPPSVRTAEQGAFQLAALGVTLLTSLVGGVLTGFIIKLPFFLYQGPILVCRAVVWCPVSSCIRRDTFPTYTALCLSVRVRRTQRHN